MRFHMVNYIERRDCLSEFGRETGNFKPRILAGFVLDKMKF